MSHIEVCIECMVWGAPLWEEPQDSQLIEFHWPPDGSARTSSEQRPTHHVPCQVQDACCSVQLLTETTSPHHPSLPLSRAGERHTQAKKT